MNQITRPRWKMCSKYLGITAGIIILLCINSDSTYFKPVKVLAELTADEIAESCAPSKIISLSNINVSSGAQWSLGHSYHCLGRPHVITTMNHVGILAVDKLVSHAIVLNYVWLINQSKDEECSLDVEKVKPIVFESDTTILFAPYVLSCQKI